MGDLEGEIKIVFNNIGVVLIGAGLREVLSVVFLEVEASRDDSDGEWLDVLERDGDGEWFDALDRTGGCAEGMSFDALDRDCVDGGGEGVWFDAPLDGGGEGV